MYGYLEKEMQTPMARGRSTQSSRCYCGFKPVVFIIKKSPCWLDNNDLAEMGDFEKGPI